MEYILKKYNECGSFSFKLGDSLSIVSGVVPNKPGVYIIYGINSTNSKLVYIGKSGTIINDGSFKTQLLRKRLNNKQEGLRRQVYFENKLKEDNCNELKVCWFVTFNDEIKDLPGFVEGQLIQKYFEQYKRLPDWNKDF